MRLLVISGACPFPSDSGAKMRTAALLGALAARGDEIDFFALDPASSTDGVATLARYCRAVRLFPAPRVPLAQTSLLRAALTLPRRWPHSVLRFRHAALRDAIALALREGYDALLCDSVHSAIHVAPVAPLPPVILHTHNVEHRLLLGFARLGAHRDLYRRLYARMEAVKMRRFETAVARRARVVCACSEADAEQFRRLAPGVCVVVVPNVVESDRYPAAAGDDGATLLFAGAMDWLPNRDAVSFFAARVWPLVRRGAPGARFLIAGRNPPARLRRLAGHHGFEVAAPVADMRPLLARAAVCVVPLRMGSGTRLKILEAAAAAKAIVATPQGAEGLLFKPGQEILLADDPAAFAAAVLRLLADSNRRAALGRAARRRVEATYGPAALADALARVFDALVPTSTAVSEVLAERP